MNHSPHAAMVEQPTQLASRANYYGMQTVDLDAEIPDHALLTEFPRQLLFAENMLPLRVEQANQQPAQLLVAIADPTRLQGLNQLAMHSSWPIEPLLADEDQIRRALNRLMGVGGGMLAESDETPVDEAEELCSLEAELNDRSQASSVMRLVNELIAEAVHQGASDIHIEPEKDELIVRYRLDGVLQQQPVPAEIQRYRAAIVSRIKIMARLNIAERRLPQDGRAALQLQNREVELRVSVIPTHHGESVVLRLLSTPDELLSLDKLNIPQSTLTGWRKLISNAHGLVLVTGPTGSGKTTTLYGSLTSLRSPQVKIATIEDPIEYKLRQISQIQVDPAIGLTFASGLRSLLRHDPDIVLVGEIRDAETAQIAVQSAMTGHLVFSTLHTNDAATAFTRLMDMGVAPYLAGSTVQGVLAQRLVRRLCPHCKEPDSHQAYAGLVDDLQLENANIFKAAGCQQCHGTGYRGRQAIFELLHADESIRDLCLQRSAAGEIRKQAQTQGMQTLRNSAAELVQSGVTSISELMRVTPG